MSKNPLSSAFRAIENLPRPEKWGVLFFLLHSLLYVLIFHSEPLTGVDAVQYLGTILPLLEFWWFLPLSLVIIPLRGIVDFKVVFFYSLWSDYRFIVVILIGSVFYGLLGYCIGMTGREPVGENPAS